MVQRAMFLLVLAAAAITAAAPSPLSAQVPREFESRWQAIVSDRHATLDSAGIVGSTLAFVHDGEIVAVDYFGLEDIASDRPVDEHTIYHWASITKTFTGTAIMQLRDRGLLSLDDPIVKYVPELRDVYNPYGSMEEVTIRHLLTHSSGFRGPTWPWGGDESWHPHEPTKWSQLVAMIPYTRILFPPGSRWSYSNPGIIFLGRTIEKLTGDVYEAYIEKNIFDPLGMETAYFDVTPWRLLDDRSNNYRVVDGGPVAGGLDFNTGITVSNGGLNTTVGEMARWMDFLTGAPDARRPAYEQVLERTTVEEMFRPDVPIADSTPLGPSHMGLSVFVYDDAGHRLIGHTGEQKSFISFILFDPEARVGAIASFNTSGGDETAPDTNELSGELQVRMAHELFPLFRADHAASPD